MSSYIIALGSNRDNRFEFLKTAKEELRRFGKLVQCSSIYESPPMGYNQQDYFLNAVCELKSDINPLRLLRKIKIIETKLGRQRSFHWGPREIDIDIIDWNGNTFNDRLLTLPHPEMDKRDFVLLPLLEIKKDYISRNGKSIRALCAKFLCGNLKLITDKW